MTVFEHSTETKYVRRPRTQVEQAINLSDPRALRDNSMKMIELTTSAISIVKGRDEGLKYLTFVLSTAASHIGRTYGREALDAALGEAIVISDGFTEDHDLARRIANRERKHDGEGSRRRRRCSGR